jgi:myo-inositol-1(or 4)-monophosphatase
LHTDLERALRIAEEAARAGGAVLRSRQGDLGHVREKSDVFDVVTDVDIASGVETVLSILGDDPNARFIIEEDEVFGETDARRPRDAFDGEVWMIDPLDGTTSYVHGYPCYSVSVALLSDGRPVVGAIYDAASDHLFSAKRGGGSTQDGRELRCTAVSEMARSLLVTGFPYDRGEPLRRQLAILGPMIERAHDLRRDGSAALDCCHVAAGRCDGYWELGLKPWDIAAGIVIIEEAGGVVTNFDGGPIDLSMKSIEVVTANPAIHSILLNDVIHGKN